MRGLEPHGLYGDHVRGFGFGDVAHGAAHGRAGSIPCETSTLHEQRTARPCGIRCLISCVGLLYWFPTSYLRLSSLMCIKRSAI